MFQTEYNFSIAIRHETNFREKTNVFPRMWKITFFPKQLQDNCSALSIS